MNEKYYNTTLEEQETTIVISYYTKVLSIYFPGTKFSLGA